MANFLKDGSGHVVRGNSIPVGILLGLVVGSLEGFSDGDVVGVWRRGTRSRVGARGHSLEEPRHLH